MNSDIHFVTGWSRYDNAWTVVHAEHLLDVCKPEKEAMYYLFYYIPWTDTRRTSGWIALRMRTFRWPIPVGGRTGVLG